MKSGHQITFDFAVTKPEEAVEVSTPVPETEPGKKRGRKPKDPTTIIKKPPSKRGRKSLKDVEAEADLTEVPGDEELFQKQYYSMSEVAGMFRINQSLLRFWANEFNILQPKKNKKGDRLFRPADIKNLSLIHHLLRQRKYTLEGAKDFLKNKGTTAERKYEVIQTLQKLKTLLMEIRANL